MVKRYWKETGQVPSAVGEHPDGDYVKFADYAALAAELAAHKRLNADLEASDVRLRARILNLRTALLAVRPVYLEYCDNADIIDAALAADSQSSGETKP